MKKVFLGLICSLLVVGLAIGCGKESTTNEIEKYLNEKFDIIKKEMIENVDGNCKSDENSKYKNKGYKYNVKSNTTNIEFVVKDVYEKSSYGTCDYDLVDNYYEQSLNKYIAEFNDDRIVLDTHMLNSDIKVDYFNFNSIKELANVLYNFKKYYENKHPFMTDADVNVYIYNSNKYIGVITLSYTNIVITLDSLNTELNKILNS